MSSGGEMYYRGGSGGGVNAGYYGRESSGRGAFHAHAEEKRRAAQAQKMLVGLAASVVAVLIVVVWVLSRRGHLPANYVSECQATCASADYLCGTICEKAMVGVFAREDLKASCARGCGAFGNAACAQACASNDLGSCQTAMQARAASEFCSMEEDSASDTAHSARKACEIGAGAVATTQWPCSVGVKNIGRILSEHKM